MVSSNVVLLSIEGLFERREKLCLRIERNIYRDINLRTIFLYKIKKINFQKFISIYNNIKYFYYFYKFFFNI